MKMTLSAASRLVASRAICALIVLTLGCGGGSDGSSSGSPTGPTPGSSSTVKVDVTYYTQHSTRDPDNFSLTICPSGSRDCQLAFTTDPAARQPGSITWTGRLAPGTYTALVELYFADRSIDIMFASAAGGGPGGVERNSVRFKEANSGPVNTYVYRPCGVTTLFSQRPDLALNVLETYVTFEFVVGAGSGAGTC